MADATMAQDLAAAARLPPSKSENIFMQIAVHPDGTITRPFVPSVPASLDAAVSSRDVPLDASLGTYIRLYLPNPVDPPPSAKLPIILYFHGGGYVIFSADTVFYHASCEAMAVAVPAIVASVDYRLAPEHRLPAAYDDGVAAMMWLRDEAHQDPWIAERGDLSQCFLMGSSSGGNLVFNAAVRTRGVDLSPATVRGVLMHQPYVGGVERTPSEAASEDDFMVPLEANDKLIALALPLGADRDHEFSNPEKAMAPEALAGLPRCMISGSDGDPLIDRQRGFTAWLRDGGVDVVDKTDISGFHAAELFIPEKAEELFAAVREFVHGGGGDA
ncbi:probable carboxylesterase 8 [Lolium perenne]|uniref:probable carboxylesterase 8 n=1 Tax=Lolium perenne TaxID=4522 RepID=UPI0021F55BEC|nr:probable carboxylesterase 8 [Lolium perenne]